MTLDELNSLAWTLDVDGTWFYPAKHDFADLEIRTAKGGGAHYFFYDRSRSTLIKDFVIWEGTKVDHLCSVSLVKSGDSYRPKLRLWVADKTKKAVATFNLDGPPDSAPVTAAVNLDRSLPGLVLVVDFMRSLSEVDSPVVDLAFVDKHSANLLTDIAEAGLTDSLDALREAFGDEVRLEDVLHLFDRRKAVQRFDGLLNNPDEFIAELAQHSTTPEGVWQKFFQENQWIFGLGLNQIAFDSLPDGVLETIVAGADGLGSVGKRVDALMRTRAALSSLVFIEIKRHDECLLTSKTYRSGVFAPSAELVGGVAQVQATAAMAVKPRLDYFSAETSDGDYVGSFGTVGCRKILVIGSNREFLGEDAANPKKLASFERYRSSVSDVDIVTYDELFERAKFVVGLSEGETVNSEL